MVEKRELTASVQYDDFKGTVAVDEEMKSFTDFLRNKKLIAADEFLTALSCYALTNVPDTPREFSITVYVLKGSGRDAIVPLLKNDPILARKFEINLTADEFLKHYKRFEIVLTPKGLGLAGREIEG